MQAIHETEGVTGKWALVAGACVLAIAAVGAGLGAIHARLYGHDIFFLLDNGWRAFHGQRVHADYSSAYGPLTFLPVAAGLAVSGGSVAAITYGNAIFAAAAGLWAVWLAAGRQKNFLVVVCACFVALIAVAPFALGDPPNMTSQAMIYNRYGYALLFLLMLESYLPGRKRWLEPALTGVVLGLLLFLKVSYFLVALPLLGIPLIFRKDRSSRAIAHSIGFSTTFIIFLAYLRFDAAAVLADLQMAAAARSGTLGIGRSAAVLLVQGGIRASLLVASAVLCQRWLGWDARFYALAALVMVGADTSLLLTNAQVVSYPLTAFYSVLLLLATEPVGKAFKLLGAVACLLALPMMIAQVMGLGFALLERNTNPPGILRFESPRLNSLVLYDISPDDTDHYSNGREYVSSINDGMRLLAAHTQASDKITTLDMANPFPFAMNRAPVRGGIALGAYGFTLNDLHHLSPARYFADSAVVMVPKYPALAPIFYDGYLKIYEPTLQKEFRLEAESARWRLYRRGADSGK